MAWADQVTGLNDTLLAEFGETVTIQHGVEQVTLEAILTEAVTPQQDSRPGFVSAQFRSSDMPGLDTGDKLTTAQAVYRLVETDRQLDNWTKVKLQKVADL